MANDANDELQPSSACVALVERSEGFRPVAYWDQDGWACGYGHHGPDVVEGTVWTLAQAQAALAGDLTTVADEVKALVNVPLTQGQFDALCDFAYNEGSGRLARSMLLVSINAGRLNSVPDQLCRQDPETGEWHGWVMAAGAVNMGLVARRQQEIALWNGEQA